jgi:hypothetical protein
MVTTGTSQSIDQILSTIRTSITSKARNDTDVVRSCNAAFARFDRVSRLSVRLSLAGAHSCPRFISSRACVNNVMSTM